MLNVKRKKWIKRLFLVYFVFDIFIIVYDFVFDMICIKIWIKNKFWIFFWKKKNKRFICLFLVFFEIWFIFFILRVVN